MCVSLLRILVIEWCGNAFDIFEYYVVFVELKNLFDFLGFVLFMMFVAVFDWRIETKGRKRT